MLSVFKGQCRKRQRLAGVFLLGLKWAYHNYSKWKRICFLILYIDVAQFVLFPRLLSRGSCQSERYVCCIFSCMPFCTFVLGTMCGYIRNYWKLESNSLYIKNIHGQCSFFSDWNCPACSLHTCNLTFALSYICVWCLLGPSGTNYPTFASHAVLSPYRQIFFKKDFICLLSFPVSVVSGKLIDIFWHLIISRSHWSLISGIITLFYVNAIIFFIFYYRREFVQHS